MTVPQASRRGRSAVVLLAPVAAVGLAAAALTPTDALADGPTLCPFRLLTGLPCPLCGLTRAWVATMHGDLPTALQLNPFGPPTVAFAVVAVLLGLQAVLDTGRRDRGLSPRPTGRAPALGGMALLVYGLVRLVAVQAGWWPWPY